MELSEEDVLHILKLIDESNFDYFQLEAGDLKITVSKGEPIPLGTAPQNAAASQNAAAPFQSPKSAAPAPQPQTPKVEPRTVAIPEGLVPITAPLLGTFYAAPEPGAPPFIKVGAIITEDTTVGLIEVMKVFNSVSAGVQGTVVEMVAQNGQFVEYGQALFLVKP